MRIPIVLLPLLFAALWLTVVPLDAKAQEAGSGQIEIADAQVSLIQNTFVAAPIAGVVAEVLVAEGDQVDAGQGLVQFDAEQAQTELDAARAGYDAARLESDNDVSERYATRTLEVRQRELQQSMEANTQFTGSVSETEIAKQQLVVDQARLAIEQAQHDLKIARARAVEKLAAMKIVEARVRKHGVQATVAGTVAEVAVEPGEWVEAGKPIVRVLSLNPIRVECFVDGRVYGPELVGRGIEFFLADTASAEAETPLRGNVTFVSPELNPVTGQARLWATIENPKLAARAGMRGRLVIGSK